MREDPKKYQIYMYFEQISQFYLTFSIERERRNERYLYITHTKINVIFHCIICILYIVYCIIFYI